MARWVHDERKNGIANKFKIVLKNVNPKGINVAERNLMSMQKKILENC
jgi:hypothetical protein